MKRIKWGGSALALTALMATAALLPDVSSVSYAAGKDEKKKIDEQKKIKDKEPWKPVIIYKEKAPTPTTPPTQETERLRDMSGTVAPQQKSAAPSTTENTGPGGGPRTTGANDSAAPPSADWETGQLKESCRTNKSLCPPLIPPGFKTEAPPPTTPPTQETERLRDMSGTVAPQQKSAAPSATESAGPGGGPHKAGVGGGPRTSLLLGVLASVSAIGGIVIASGGNDNPTSP